MNSCLPNRFDFSVSAPGLYPMANLSPWIFENWEPGCFLRLRAGGQASLVCSLSDAAQLPSHFPRSFPAPLPPHNKDCFLHPRHRFGPKPTSCAGNFCSFYRRLPQLHLPTLRYLPALLDCPLSFLFPGIPSLQRSNSAVG